MNGRRLGLPGFGDDPRRALDASVADVEESIRRRLYGERRTVHLMAHEDSPADSAGTAPGAERPVTADTPP